MKVGQQLTLSEGWRELLKNDYCPVVGCGGELTTGYECRRCEADFVEFFRHSGKETNLVH